MIDASRVWIWWGCRICGFQWSLETEKFVWAVRFFNLAWWIYLLPLRSLQTPRRMALHLFLGWSDVLETAIRSVVSFGPILRAKNIWRQRSTFKFNIYSFPKTFEKFRTRLDVPRNRAQVSRRITSRIGGRLCQRVSSRKYIYSSINSSETSVG